MEAAFVNVVEPGDVVVVGVNGVFGERMCDVAGRCGAEVVRVEAEWGRALDPQALLDAHPAPAAHRGRARRDVDRRPQRRRLPRSHGQGRRAAARRLRHVARRHPRRDRRAGGSTSPTAAPRSASACPPGLAPFTAGDRGRSTVSLERPQSWYLDLNMIARYVTGEGARAYHHTAPISMIFALHAGARRGARRGPRRVRGPGTGRAARPCRPARRAAGFELFAAGGPPAARADHGLGAADRAAERRRTRPACGALLLDRYGIEIGGGLGAFAGQGVAHRAAWATPRGTAQRRRCCSERSTRSWA